MDLLFVDRLSFRENGPWPYSQRKIQGLVKKVCKKADLRIRNPHDLRHTYATILLMATRVRPMSRNNWAAARFRLPLTPAGIGYRVKAETVLKRRFSAMRLYQKGLGKSPKPFSLFKYGAEGGI